MLSNGLMRFNSTYVRKSAFTYYDGYCLMRFNSMYVRKSAFYDTTMVTSKSSQNQNASVNHVEVLLLFVIHF